MAFARYVREGRAGRGHKVRVGSVQNAIGAIGTTFAMAGLPNPTYQPGLGKAYWDSISRMLATYTREDPKAQPKLAVPVGLTQHLLDQHPQAPPHEAAKREAAADLINIAFYYLLRVGEYTKPKSHRTNTIPIRVADITFRNHHGHKIPHTAPLQTLLQAAEATIWIPNQKKGTKGECIHHQCTGTPHSPIKSLARRIHHILSHGGTGSTGLYYYQCPFNTGWQAITSHYINTTLKRAAADTNLYQLGYTPSDVSSHSLRAGGAMAMHLNGIDITTIMKIGRWKSITFLNYIHEQISAFTTGVSIKMSTNIPFRHIAGPTLVTNP